jgi:16S rRNA (cytosine1402-N4)-methyltransferase
MSLRAAIAPACRATEPVTLHRPVLLSEALAGLRIRPDGIYIDGTYGRGGHSGAILDMLGPTGFLHAMDQDPEACAHAWKQHGTRSNFRIHHRNFSELGALAAEAGIAGRVDGVLLDLGVSSPQLDEAARGFSFSHDGPLDMRMNPRAGISAADWLARAGEVEIADVLWRFGEERNSRRIARRIVEALSRNIHPATRSFQAIRIHINRELEALESALAQAVEVLAPAGRVAVISFHSLEDRIVKRYLRAQAQGDAPRLKVERKLFPGAEECAGNPRARSAILRVAERLP